MKQVRKNNANNFAEQLVARKFNAWYTSSGHQKWQKHLELVLKTSYVLPYSFLSKVYNKFGPT